MVPADSLKRGMLLKIIMTVFVCWVQAEAGEISQPGAPRRPAKKINLAEINYQAVSGGPLRFAEVEIVTSERFSVEDISVLASAPGSDLEVLSAPSRVKVQLPAGEVQALIDAGAEVTVVREFLLFEGFAGSEETAGSDPAVNVTCTGDYLYDVNEYDEPIPANGDWGYSIITLSGAPDKAEVTCIDVHVEIKDYNSTWLYADLTDEDYEGFAHVLYDDYYTGDDLLTDYGVTTFNGRLANQMWIVWATNDDTGSGGWIDRWWIKVYYHVPDYCTATSEYCGYEYISNVEVGDISNATDCEYYADYTEMSTAMDIGTGYGITVTNGYPDPSDECGIWVDWNQDGDFDDASETISVSGSPGVGPYTATITPPETATAGDCRLRVRMCYDVTPNPCGTCEYGEVEDYTISVTGGPTYCEAQGGESGCGYGITGFKLKTIDNPTGDCEQYADYTSISTELEKGTGYPFVITQADWGTGCGLWVDWNQDFDFDDVNEQINVTYFEYENPPYGDPLYTIYHIGIITPPEGAVLGATRLRVRSRTYGNTMAPCGNTGDGEVEDYTVIVAPNGASGEASYGGGQGTEEEPFLIYTAQQMQTIGENNYHWAKHFKLTADIDLSEFSGETFNIIGDYMFNFTGAFDGNGHSISNFTYDATDGHRIGIFGEISGANAVIKNLGLVDTNVDVDGGEGIGALAGTHKGGTISNCYVRSGSVSGQEGVGGLVGGNHALIENCYSTVSVSGVSSYGGLVGKSIGGSTTDSFWDTETCLPATGSAGGTGKTTAEMQTESTYTDAGWDFVGEVINGTEDIWEICEGTNYPKFTRQVVLGDLVCPDGVDGIDVGVLCEEWLLEELPCDVWPEGGDGFVDFLDWAIIADGWGDTYDISDLANFADTWLKTGITVADIAPYGGDGIVNMEDFATLAENWLEGTY